MIKPNHDKRVRRYMVLDTETCDLHGNVYDIGYTIANRAGEFTVTRNWLVEEIFTDAKKMMGAFYAKKLFSHYAPMLQRQEIRLTPWSEIVEKIRHDIIEHGINCIAAYNSDFDFRVMRQTHKALGNVGSILSNPITKLCLWRFACKTRLAMPTYQQIAKENGWITSKGNLRTGAEYAYRFCSGDWGFIEDHTALSDAIIETDIMAKCFSLKKGKVPYNEKTGLPWQLIQK